MANTLAKTVCILVIVVNVIAIWNMTEETPSKVAQQVTYDQIINAEQGE